MMEANVTAPAQGFIRAAGRQLGKAGLLVTRVAGVSALPVLAPGAPLLLAPVWQHLRGQKDYFHRIEQMHPEVVTQYGVTPSAPDYGAMKRRLDAILDKHGQEPATIIVPPPLLAAAPATLSRSRTVVMPKHYLEFLSADDRDVVMTHEAGHLVKQETRHKDLMDVFAHNARDICRKVSLPVATLLAAAKVAETVLVEQFPRTAEAVAQVTAPLLATAKTAGATIAQQFPRAAEALTQVASAVLPASPDAMLVNAAFNVIVVLPAVLAAQKYFTRRAEFASDRFVVDERKEVDGLTHLLLRLETYPDPKRQASMPMGALLTKPKLGWQHLKDKLNWSRLTAAHPTAAERIRAAYDYAESQGIRPRLSRQDTWHASQPPQLSR